MSLGGFAHSRAVLIAVDRYANGISPLRTPVADATALADLLRDKHGYQVDLLTDEAATLRGIRTFMERFARRVYPDDRVLFYFAGHGIAVDSSDGPRGYILPQDASKDGGAEASFLPMVELDALLTAIDCRHMLVILDCCFAGAMRWSSARHAWFAQGQLHQERFRWYVEDPAWQALASAAHDQKALDVAGERPLGKRDDAQAHSPFAAALIAGLQGAADLPTADGLGDGVITATELYLYIDGALRESVASDVRAQRQMPILWPMRKHNKGQYVFQVPDSVVVLPPAPPLDTEDNPWRGLESYHESHQQLFFGRTGSIRKLAGRLQGGDGGAAAAGEQLLVVIGPSGIGKSSLVAAGLVPQLREQGCYPLQVRPGIPSSSPFANLAAALALLPADVPVSAAQLENDGLALAAWANRVHEPVVLIVDQAEELVTVDPGGGQVSDFLQLLANALETSHLRVVMTLRSEYEPQFSQSPLSARWAAARFLVPRMTQDDIRRVIEAPAAVRVLRFESDELVDQLINDVINMPGALPLLSFALSQMYIHYLQRRDDDRTLTRADYDSLEGGVTGALRMTANALVEGRDGAYAMTARRVLTRFVAIERGEYSRRRVPKWELISADEEEQRRITALLQSLTRAALVISDSTPLDPGGLRDEGGQHAYYELAHDALILGWERLNGWIREDSAKIHALRKLTQAAADWENSGHAQDGLLWTDQIRGKLAQQFSAEYAADTNTVEARFVQASLRRQTLNRRRGRIALAMAALVVVGLLIAVSAAFIQSGNKQVAQSLKLAGVSTQLAERGDYARAALVAVAALPRQPLVGRAEVVPEVEDALYTALANLLQRHVLRGHKEQINSARLTTDGRYLLTGSRDKTVKLWILESGTLRWSTEFDTEVLAIAIDRKGLARAVTKTGGIFQLDLVSGNKSEIASLPGDWSKAEFSSSGRSLMLVANDFSAKRSRLVIMRGEQFRRRFELAHASEVSSQQWHALEETLAVAFDDGSVRVLDERNRIWVFDAGAGSSKSIKFVEARQALLVSQGEDYWEWHYTDDAIPKTRRVFLKGWPMAVSVDGTLLATGHIDGCVRVWRWSATPMLIATMNWPCKASDVYALTPSSAQFISDKELLLSSDDRTASIWEFPEGLRQQRYGMHNARVANALLSRQLDLVVTIPDHTADVHDIYLWARKPLLEPQSFRLGEKDRVESVALSGDGRMLAAAARSGDARIWTLGTGTSLLIPGPAQPVAMNFAADNRSVVIRSDEETAAWRLPSTLLYRGPSLDSGLHSDWTHPTCILAPGRSRQYFDVIRLSDGRRLRPPAVALGMIISAAEAAPDCSRTAFANGTSLYVQNMSAPFQHTAVRLPETIRALSWSPSGRLLFVMTSSYVYLFKEGLTTSRGFVFDKLEQVTFSNDERFAALRSASAWMTVDLAAPVGGVTSEFFDPATPDAAHSGEINDLQFSPDGKYVITAAGDFTAKIWEARGGRHVQTFRGHGDALKNARFSPDGKKVLTSAYISEMGLEGQNPGISESQAILWDAVSGKPLAHLENRERSVVHALFSSDGRTVFTASISQNDVRAWQVFDSVQALRDFGCARIDARLNPRERLVLIGADIPDDADCARPSGEK